MNAPMVTTELGLTNEKVLDWADRAQARIDAAADELIEAAAATRWGCGEPFEDAVRWLAEAAVRKGHPTTTDLHVAVSVGDGSFNAKRKPRLPEPATRVVPSKPTAQHLRLHRLADRDGGWFCRACAVGLIDVCSDEDVTWDQYGRRLLRPGCTKRIAVRDHTIPVHAGGSNGDDNSRLLCEECNARKGAA